MIRKNYFFIIRFLKINVTIQFVTFVIRVAVTIKMI